MKTIHLSLKSMVFIIVAILAFSPVISAQDRVEPEQAFFFSQEELTQMLAPIALYPDSLMAQILMASTYPLEIVEAERWLRLNRHLPGEALDQALQEKTWDPSVKSLCHFPDVLLALSDRLEQTVKLGDAFLNQQDDVMATIQELRHRAHEQGTLETSQAQQVIIEREIIRIEPADPRVVYVPVYDPLYVYGPWWCPAHPPYYWYYPAGYVVQTRYISYRPPVFIGVGLFSWVWFDWPVYRIYIDFRHTRPFHIRPISREVNIHVWRHNPAHRRGVAYRDIRTSERFGPRPQRIAPPSPALGSSNTPRPNHPSRPLVERRSTFNSPRLRSERTPGTLSRHPVVRDNNVGQAERRSIGRGEEILPSRDTRTPRVRPERTPGTLSRDPVVRDNRPARGDITRPDRDRIQPGGVRSERMRDHGTGFRR